MTFRLSLRLGVWWYGTAVHFCTFRCLKNQRVFCIMFLHARVQKIEIGLILQTRPKERLCCCAM